MKEINLGLIGLGTVGTGVVKILQQNEEVISARLGFHLKLKRVADLDMEKSRGLNFEEGVLTREAMDIINDPRIDVVIELIGGIEPARTFITKSIEKGKHVVTANKALLANHGQEIFQLAREREVDIGFEASVGGGIPIIRALREGFAANNIQSIYGIVNGTANYILTKMSHQGLSFDSALKEAQTEGYAEADPTYDIEGIDSAHKITILARLGFGYPVKFNEVNTEGISRINKIDIELAQELGYCIKLLAIAKRVDSLLDIRVHPTMISKENLLATVDGVFNAICVTGDMVGPNIFIGQGAGAFPTGSAIIGDIMEISRAIFGSSPGRVPLSLPGKSGITGMRQVGEILSQYYLRFSALDRPGVLSTISGLLGKYQISIATVFQKGRAKGPRGDVPIVILTHRAKEIDMQSALLEIDMLEVITDKTTLIRMEDEEEEK
ncbi:MAG: homoserine dehydrogenase [Candidatus Tectomicrobia bacterium]|uniref:Homoserine dehydrogenase n=1 Tax=Tectimicrobiota bacterium TaxID=2528274 RepID=A0A933GNR9_UNCTE|nr:homoserine dehydrogenase [Candidatus Tectomicrobia bacterium]